MIAFLLVGVLLAGALLLLLNWWANADVKSAKNSLFWLIILVCILLAGVLLAAGRGLLAIFPAAFALVRMFGPGLLASVFKKQFLGGEQQPGGGNVRHGSMTDAEAREILDVDEAAGDAEIKEAYRRLMAQVHPDKGGSDWMAAKLNEARKTLLGDG